MVDSVWLRPGDVLSYLEDVPYAVPNPVRPALQDACNAVAGWVEEDARPDLWTLDVDGVRVPPYDPGPTVKLGAVMFAARLYERRGSILGATGYQELGGSPILQEDPDIARLLGIGTASGGFPFASTPRHELSDVEL